jgi:ribosomal protein S18 acetylase RimI-like enzyme
MALFCFTRGRRRRVIVTVPRAKLSTKLRPPSFRIVARLPTPEEYTSLNAAVGWAGYTNLEPIPEALKNSLFGVVALQKEKVVGTGRLVGDGVRFIYIQDLMVLPKCQGKGIGTAIMDALMEYINEHAPRKTYIHLFTNGKTAGFYERYGFRGPEQPFYGMSVKKFDKPLRREVS